MADPVIPAHVRKEDLILRLPLKMKSTAAVYNQEKMAEMGVKAAEPDTVWATCSLFLDKVIAWYDHGRKGEVSVLYGANGDDSLLIVGVSYHDFDSIVQKVCPTAYYINVVPEKMDELINGELNGNKEEGGNTGRSDNGSDAPAA